MSGLTKMTIRTLLSLVVATMMLCDANVASAFAPLPAATTTTTATMCKAFNQNAQRNGVAQLQAKPGDKEGGFFSNVKNMMNDFDDVMDDFFFKRMGAGEQWYGKRKSNPSGRVDGNYNGMGRSDQIKIEIARAMKEEMELKRTRALEAEEERRKRSGSM
mmetsp:Transcript_7455/g.20161  ORF Transcript_7455/g.20161 Transcript_7455/m.20161 type:complete len:160 (-) Transcript_7455:420-899(-)